MSDKIRDPLQKLRQRTFTSSDDIRKAYTILEGDQNLLNIVDTPFDEYDESQQAKYGISFLEMVEFLTNNIHAIRTRNWPEFYVVDESLVTMDKN